MSNLLQYEQELIQLDIFESIAIRLLVMSYCVILILKDICTHVIVNMYIHVHI